MEYTQIIKDEWKKYWSKKYPSVRYAHAPGLSDKQRKKILKNMDDDFLHGKGLTPSQGAEMIKDIYTDAYSYIFAINFPDITPAQRWELVKGIKDEEYRHLSAENVPELTPEQRRELRGEANEELHRHQRR